MAIEAARQRPSQCAGAISMEGWTHHEVEQAAFGGSAAPTLSAAQERERLANRERVLSRLTEEEQDESKQHQEPGGELLPARIRVASA